MNNPQRLTAARIIAFYLAVKVSYAPTIVIEANIVFYLEVA